MAWRDTDTEKLITFLCVTNDHIYDVPVAQTLLVSKPAGAELINRGTFYIDQLDAINLKIEDYILNHHAGAIEVISEGATYQYPVGEPLTTLRTEGRRYVSLLADLLGLTIGADYFRMPGGITITGPTGPAGPTGPTGPTGPAGSDATATIGISVKTANYTAILSDKNTLVRMNLSTAGTFTIPLNSSVAFSIGDQLMISQAGTGQITLTPAGGGVTLNSRIGLKTAGQRAVVVALKTNTDEWLVFGDLTS